MVYTKILQRCKGLLNNDGVHRNEHVHVLLFSYFALVIFLR